MYVRNSFGILVALGLAGCAASGVQVTEQQAQSFVVGKSTYGEVVSALGEPTTATTSSKGERTAVYSYTAVSSRLQNYLPYVGGLVSGYDTKSSNVTFVFDARGVLRDTTSTQANLGSGANLAASSPQGGANPLMPGR